MRWKLRKILGPKPTFLVGNLLDVSSPGSDLAFVDADSLHSECAMP